MAETRKIVVFSQCPIALLCAANAVTGADEVTKMPTTPTTSCSFARFAPLDSTDEVPLYRCIRIPVQNLENTPEYYPIIAMKLSNPSIVKINSNSRFQY